MDEKNKEKKPDETADEKKATETVSVEEAAAEADAARTAPEAEQAAEAPAPEAVAEPDWKDMYARMRADFDNFRKRTQRDREDLFKSAAGDVIKDMLPTVDTLALALAKVPAGADDAFVKGVQLTYESFLKALETHGAKPIESKGEPFDANYHEAIAQLPSADVEEGHIIDETKRGWLLNGKLLRAAQVVVSSGKQA